jgi:hypothetical protein
MDPDKDLANGVYRVGIMAVEKRSTRRSVIANRSSRNYKA